jgi:hypothetical protein
MVTSILISENSFICYHTYGQKKAKTSGYMKMALGDAHLICSIYALTGLRCKMMTSLQDGNCVTFSRMHPGAFL